MKRVKKQNIIFMAFNNGNSMKYYENTYLKWLGVWQSLSLVLHYILTFH